MADGAEPVGVAALLGDGRVTRATLAAQVEDAIRIDIIAGELEPGRRLRASELTQRYGVSATPLREALQRLAALNLVELDPRFGATVAAISESEFHDIYWLRGILESLALERSIEFGGEQWEREATNAFQAFERFRVSEGTPSAAEVLAWSTVHRAFHDALFQACNSSWLLRFVNTLSDHSERYRMYSRRRGLRHPIEEHRAIYAAAMARDTAAAIDALRSHLSGTVNIVDTLTRP